MRISTNTIFETGGSQISDLQASLYRTQQQISANRKILNPGDDPIGSARALVISQSDAINDHLAANRSTVKSSLNTTEGALQSVTTLLQNAKGLVVSAGNGTLTPADRATYATQLQSSLSDLLGLANSQDGFGDYMFSGYATTTTPYTQTANGATYNGDQGQRKLQVDTSRQLALSDIGPAIFGNIRASGTTFNTRANTANTGTTAISAAISVPPAALTGHNYSVVFTNATTFNVTDTTTGNVVSSGNPYTSPSTSVNVDGIAMTLSDAVGPGGVAVPPATGDRFSVQPGNQNIFETLTDVINALKGPSTSAQDKVDLQAALAQANSNIDKSLDNVSNSRTTVGASLAEIDTLDNDGTAKGINYKAALSGIQDLDYAKAITTLTQQQITLQAAQKSFMSVSGLSLFALL
ncbi:flagellar hook-associated protein FlgL [Undibacterium sp.]|jgi:flagellar hook-associated protein 3 FlgL|uniref:flagellar hook-associated protein FlgL n=1 Tax=Undibacterium sp. TaxID=1914977 RepID=UPI002B8A948F|nr:flagellar hook-associated protein FlgL [Undibacterium sp.]HTD05387.1 flagellar hook-associated protein FlgL [Undibacterium sp.]